MTEKVNKKTGEITSGDETPAPTPRKYAKVFHLPSRTKQSFRSEVNINSIVAKAKQVGSLPSPHRPPVFADVASIPSFETAHNIVQTAKDAFMRLPAYVRERMNNTPENLPAYLTDPKNLQEAIKFGLLKKIDSNEKSKKSSPPSSPPPAAPAAQPPASKNPEP